VLIVLAAGLCAASAVADEAAIRQLVGSYAEAFNGKDVNNVAACWAENATHCDHHAGVRTEGRDAIMNDIAAAFRDHPNAVLEISVERVQMIRPDIARVDGQTSIGAPDEEPTVTAFTGIVVNENGRWVISSVDEVAPHQPATAHDALHQLDWLIGHWVDESEEIRVDTTFRWAGDQSFLVRSFSVETAAGESQNGTQIIGWDPRSQEIRSWTFNSDGSFGDGIWSRSGEDWLIQSSQTLADGRAASGTFVLSRPDDQSISLQLIGHEIDGEMQPTSEAVVVTRVETPAAPAGAEADKR
jgi:uncharacterized protein (TIGR02246 family)